MNKYYVKPIIIFSTMIIMVFSMQFMSKKSVSIKTIDGNIETMDNVALSYTPNLQYFNKEKILINKDGVKYREGISNEKYLNSYDGYIYEDENYKGQAYITYDFEDENNEKYYVSVNQENKQTKEIEEIKVAIDNKEKDLNIIFNTKYKENIYSLCQSNSLDVYILKTDLKYKTSKLVQKIEKEVSGNDYINYDNLIFTNEEKIYIKANYYTPKGGYSAFEIYDMKNDKLYKSNEFMNDKHKDQSLMTKSILDYNIKENKIIFLIKEDRYINTNGNVSKLIYSINDDKITLEEKVDCNLTINYEYNYDYYNQGYYSVGEEGYGIKKIKLKDDKIYSIYQNPIVLNREGKDGKNINIQGNKAIELVVFDIKQNKTTFKANLISSDKQMVNNLYFVEE